MISTDETEGEKLQQNISQFQQDTPSYSHNLTEGSLSMFSVCVCVCVCEKLGVCVCV